MSPKAAAHVIRIASVFSILLGALMAAGAIGDPTGMLSIFFGLVSSGTQGIGGIITPEAKLSLAVAGGVFAGMCALFLFIVAPAVEAGNDQIKRGATYALIIWFVLDSGGSVAGGNSANAVANVGVLLVFLLPLLLAKSEPSVRSHP